MSDANSPNCTHYRAIAADICEPIWKSGSGFGCMESFPEIYGENRSLVFESEHFVRPTCEIDYAIQRLSTKGNPQRFFETYLGRLTSYFPQSLWALFWALVEAEHRFVRWFVHWWSHEERLTGHLIAQVFERLEDFGFYWKQISGEKESEMKIWYADTATGRRESGTGADLGLILHAHLPGTDEFYKAARFQAKKVGTNGKAEINIGQLKNLMDHSGIGHYLFYYQELPEGGILPPLVRKAEDIEGNLGLEDLSQQTKSISVLENGWDFATFITFGLADPAANMGFSAGNAQRAMERLMGEAGENLHPPSRILVITLGDGLRNVPWEGILRDYGNF